MMAGSFFSKIFGGRKIDVESIRAEIRRIEADLRQNFNADAFRNGEWFLENFRKFIERYRAHDRIRELEAAHPDLSEEQLADLLIDDAVRTSMLAGGATGAAVSAAELSGFLTWGLSLTIGAASALAEMIYMVNVQLQLTFDLAELNALTISLDEPEEMLVIFASALGAENLDLRGDGDLTELAHLAKGAVHYRLYKMAFNQLGKLFVRMMATKYAIPVFNIGVSAYLSRNMTAKVGEVARKRFGKLRRMKDRIFELRTKIDQSEQDVLRVVLSFMSSDGPLTLEETYIARELARSLQASAIWQQLVAGQLLLDTSERFIARFRDAAYFEQRETLLQALQIVSEAKAAPNEKEAEFLRKLMAG